MRRNHIEIQIKAHHLIAVSYFNILLIFIDSKRLPKRVSIFYTFLGVTNVTWNCPVIEQAAFVGTVGSTGQGDIAVDDVEITIGSCPQAGYCDFEDGFCSWTNEAALDDLDFVRGNGATDSLETGPSFDHTKGTSDGKPLM